MPRVFRSVIEMATPEAALMGGAQRFFSAVGRFLVMFFASALIGAVFGIVSAMVRANQLCNSAVY